MKFSIAVVAVSSFYIVSIYAAVTELNTDCDDFTSPNYPSKYPKGSTFEWRISVTAGKQILLQFTDVNLKTVLPCTLQPDRLYVYDGSDASAPRLVNKCRSGGFSLVSTGNEMFVRFVTKDRILDLRGRGFSAQYTAFPDNNDLNIPPSPAAPARCYDGLSRCGEKNLAVPPPATGFIIGGEETTPNEYPWMVAILFNNNNILCGGSLITPQWVLTARHCLTRLLAPRKVRLGAHDLSNSNEPGSLEINVDSKYLHPDFDKDTFEYDVGLVKLAQPISSFTDKIRMICLPDAEDPAVSPVSGTDITVTGWGRLDDGSFPAKLQHVTIPVRNKAFCDNSALPYTYFPATQFCAGVDGGGMSACFGDSGGAAMVQRYSGIVEVAGLVSWAANETIGTCGAVNNEDFYVRVSAVRTWIDDTIAANS